VVEWHVTVDGLRKDSVAVIEEEYSDGNDNGKGYELYARPYLCALVLVWGHGTSVPTMRRVMVEDVSSGA
jgi:hypothetical protein